MVRRIDASTKGCLPNLPSILAAARSSAVRTVMSGSALPRARIWPSTLACARTSFCRKSFTAIASCSARVARIAIQELATTPAASKKARHAAKATTSFITFPGTSRWADPSIL